MNSVSSSSALAPYVHLLATVLPGAGFLLADRSGRPMADCGAGPADNVQAWLATLKASAGDSPGVHREEGGQNRVAVELKGGQGKPAGWIVVMWPEAVNALLWPDPAAVAANRLLPFLPLLARELAYSLPVADAVPLTMQTGSPAEDDAIVGWLREALEQDRLRLYAQRIMPLQDFKKPSSYELLVRLRDEDGHIVSPEEFLSAAYRYQLLPAIDRWVMEHAIEMLGPVSNLLRRSDISIAINVSGQSLGDRLFVQRLGDRLAASGIPPARIMLEIAEQTALGSLQQAVEMFHQLNELGCGVALDDAGGNPRSLSILEELPVSRVKLDRMFVRDILTNPRSEEAVKAIVQVARRRRFDTVAVFVENEHVARKVRSLGIDYGQGYMFAKPEPLEQVLGLMQKDASRRVNIAEV